MCGFDPRSSAHRYPLERRGPGWSLVRISERRGASGFAALLEVSRERSLVGDSDRHDRGKRVKRIRSRPSFRSVLDQRAASDTGDVAMRAHRTGWGAFLDERLELPGDFDVKPGHLADHAHRCVLGLLLSITGVTRKRSRGFERTPRRMDEHDLARRGFDDDQCAVVVERRTDGLHESILRSEEGGIGWEAALAGDVGTSARKRGTSCSDGTPPLRAAAPDPAVAQQE